MRNTRSPENAFIAFRTDATALITSTSIVASRMALQDPKATNGSHFPGHVKSLSCREWVPVMLHSSHGVA